MSDCKQGINPITGYNDQAQDAFEHFETTMRYATGAKFNVLSHDQLELLHDIHDDLDADQRTMFLSIFETGNNVLAQALCLPQAA